MTDPARPVADRLPRYGDALTVRIDALEDDGRGTGSVDCGSLGAAAVRVRGGLPGALLEVRALRRHRRAVEAETVAVLEPGRGAVPARCEHFGPCGGCTLQHLDPALQLEHKRARVARALEPLLVLDPGLAVEPVVGMDSPWNYRNKLDLTFGARRYRVAGEAPDSDDTFALGLHVPGMWSKVLDVRECHIGFPGAAALAATVRRLAREAGLAPWDARAHTGLLRHVVLRHGVRTGQTMLVLVTSARAAEVIDPLVAALLAAHPELTTVVQDISTSVASVAIGQEQHVLFGPGTIDEVLCGRTFTLSPHSFFQTNTVMAERLFEIVRAEAALAPGALVFDLYSGAGTIGLCLSDLARAVVGFESVPAAVADARRNAARNGVESATFVEGDVLLQIAAWTAGGARPDLVVLDPPRAGLHQKVVPSVLALAAPRIVYVSCNPESAGRDLAALSAGGYRVRRIRPVDLFPHTPHVETVITLDRASGGAT